MGLLDDAIREHLDLKRRRGADPAEIERAEREALGPVRRRFDEPAELQEPASWAESLPDEDLDDDWHEPMPDSPAVRPSTSGPGYDEREDRPHAPADWEREDQFPADEPSVAAPPPERAAPPPPVHGLEEETSEYDVPVEDDLEAEDVLEGTPDFLQDTPDHDRLWFEQRPPRDFDFDG